MRERLVDIEAMADDGDVGGALTALAAAGPWPDPSVAAAAVRLEVALHARAGRLELALARFGDHQPVDPAGRWEGEVLRASVLAAAGEVHAAVRVLGHAVTGLRGEAGLTELLADAEAELESYRTLLLRPPLR